MGKYIRKSKAATPGPGGGGGGGEDVAVLDVSQLALGVRTRSRTLALKRLQKKSPAAASSSSSSQPQTASCSGGYIQLRSRRLLKPPIVAAASAYSRKVKAQTTKAARPVQNPNLTGTSGAKLGVASVDSSSLEPVPVGAEAVEVKAVGNPIAAEADGDGNSDCKKVHGDEDDAAGVEASFGENVLDSDVRGRSTRESTPCSLIRDPDALHTPCSTTKRPSLSTLAAASRGSQNAAAMHDVRTSHELDQFFAGAEEEQQRQFIEKYNFDPVSEKPLPGRYEWQKVETKESP